MAKSILLIALAILFSCCTFHKDQDYFKGEIIELASENIPLHNLQLTPFPLNGDNYGFPIAHDSLLIFFNPKLGDYFYQIFNVDTKEEIGRFCKRGNGPQEITALGPLYQLYLEDNELKTLLFAPNEEKLFVWNISRSIAEHSTILEKEYKYSWRDKNKNICYNNVFRLAPDTLLVELRSALLNNGDISLPIYQKRTISDNTLLSEYSSYQKTINNKQSVIIPEAFYNSSDALKPDGTKIVQAMCRLPQLNILNLKENSAKGYRIDSSVNFSIFKKKNSAMKGYYYRVQADNNYIYAAYLGKETFEYTAIEPQELHIYDWNGNLLKKIELDLSILEMCLDTVRNILYITNLYSDDIFYLDINKALE